MSIRTDSSMKDTGAPAPVSYPSFNEMMELFQQKIDRCECAEAYHYLIETAERDQMIVNQFIAFFARSKSDVPNLDLLVSCLERYSRNSLLETLFTSLLERQAQNAWQAQQSAQQQITAPLETLFEEFESFAEAITLFRQRAAQTSAQKAYIWLFKRAMQNEDLRDELIAHFREETAKGEHPRRSHFVFWLLVVIVESKKNQSYYDLLHTFFLANLVVEEDLLKCHKAYTRENRIGLAATVSAIKLHYFGEETKR